MQNLIEAQQYIQAAKLHLLLAVEQDSIETSDQWMRLTEVQYAIAALIQQRQVREAVR
jgi:hypothetical protein